MLEVLHKAWFALGFIVFVICWSWQGSRDPAPTTVVRTLTSAVIAAATIAIIFVITASVK